MSDEYGGLAEIPFDLKECESYQISELDYSIAKNKASFINFKRSCK